MDYQFPVWLDVYEVDEYHSFVTSGFGASMIDTVEAVVNIDEHTMPGSGHDARLALYPFAAPDCWQLL